jgi:hypothetical protein
MVNHNMIRTSAELRDCWLLHNPTLEQVILDYAFVGLSKAVVRNSVSQRDRGQHATDLNWVHYLDGSSGRVAKLTAYPNCAPGQLIYGDLDGSRNICHF